MHTTRWSVDIDLFEEEDVTKAHAVLRTSAGTELTHVGLARRSPDDPDVPEIGDELAVCRALSGLSHDLLEAAVLDVGANVGHPVSLSPDLG